VLKSIAVVTLVLAVAALAGFIGTRDLLLSRSFQAVAANPSIVADLAEMITLQPDEAVVAGASDRGAGVWVLVRRSVNASLVAYHVDRAGTQRVDLPLAEAGRLGGLVAAPGGALWVGAGDRVVAIDTGNGRALRVVSLPAVTEAVAHAQRTPDGSVLGLGQVTSLAADASGVWIARYATPSVTFLPADGAQPQTVRLPIDTDPAQFVAGSGRIWFTTNFGPNDHLGAFVGIIDPPSRQVTIVPTPAASLAAGPDGIYAIARDVRQLEGVSGTLLATRPLSAFVDATASAVDRTGGLVIRGAKQAQLHIYDRAGSEVRSISYKTGNFSGRGQVYSSTAPLAFLIVANDGTIWFAPQSGAAIYRGL
jgi:sugar lactone lactonase YvrE